MLTPPQFTPRARARSSQPTWLSGLFEQIARRMAFAAAFASIAAILAVTLPAIASWQGDGGASAAIAPGPLTGGAGAPARIEDLSAASFLGGIPFLQRSEFLASLSGSQPLTAQFLTSGREAAVVNYLDGVTADIALPAITDAVDVMRALEIWKAAIAEVQLAEAQRAATAASAQFRPSGATVIAPGTRIANTFVTFYACVGNGFCGNMANGQPVFAGAAACSNNMPFGTKFYIEGDPSGRTYVCADRGVPGPSWVDIWFYDVADGWAWQSALGGSRAEIVIVE